MGKADQNLKAQIEELAKDEKAAEQLLNIVEGLSDKVDLTEKLLGLLEDAVRPDYDSILITELQLEKPGPRIVYVNDGFTRMTGYSREEVLGKTPRILQGAKTDRAILDRLKRRLKEGQAFFGHTINYRKDGTEFINQWDIHPLMNKDGEVTHWVSYQRDVTEKKRSAKAIFNTDFDDLLKRREEFTLKFTADEESKPVCKYLTEEFEEITGLSKEELLDGGIEQVIYKDDLEIIQEGLERAFAGNANTVNCRYRTSSGDFVSVLQSFKPIWNESETKVESVKSVAKLELKEI